MVLQGDAVQGVTLLDISGQVDNILHPLSGGTPSQPLSATWPQLIALAILLGQVILGAVVSKQIGVTAIGWLHHGGGLEHIVLVSTGHFFSTVMRKEKNMLDCHIRNLCSTFYFISEEFFNLKEVNMENLKESFYPY